MCGRLRAPEAGRPVGAGLGRSNHHNHSKRRAALYLGTSIVNHVSRLPCVLQRLALFSHVKVDALASTRCRGFDLFRLLHAMCQTICGDGWTASALRDWRLRCLWPSSIDAVGQSRGGRKPANRHGLLGIVTLGAFEIVRHLQAGPPEPALDVEALVVLAAVEDGLVTPRLPGDEVEGLDDAQTQLLALLVLGDGDVLDVANGAEIMDADVRDAAPPPALVRLCLLWMDAWTHGSNAGTGPHNLRSASSAPVPTILGGLALVSSMTRTK